MIFVYYLIGRGSSVNSFSQNSVLIRPIGIILNILGLHGFSPSWINSVVPGGWYVGIIWIYICLAPMLFKLIRTTSSAVKCVFVGLLLRVAFHIICNRLLLDGTISEWADMFFINQFVFLSLGQLLYFFIIKREFSVHSIDHVLFVVMLIYVALQKDTLMIWAVVIIFMIVLMNILENTIFVNKTALWLGKYSYEIYLSHIFVMYYICQIPFLKFENCYVTIGITFVICVIVTIVFAVMLNNLVRIITSKLKSLFVIK